jgi:addiction module HigA family antidote
MAIALHPSIFVHPGPWLKEEIVKPHGLTVTQVSELLDVSRQNMSLFLNGHASLSAIMALRFEKAFGISADTMLRMQVAYDLAQVRLREGELGLERVRKVA